MGEVVTFFAPTSRGRIPTPLLPIILPPAIPQPLFSVPARLLLGSCSVLTPVYTETIPRLYRDYTETKTTLTPTTKLP